MGAVFQNLIARRLIILGITFSIILFTPLILLLVLTLIQFRLCVTLFKKLFRPKMMDILWAMSSVISSDPLYENTIMTAVMSAILQGHVPLEKLRKEVSEMFEKFEAQKPPSKPLFYQLKCHLTTLLGFSVWEKEENFRVEDHVKILDPIELNKRLQRRSDGIRRQFVVPHLVTDDNVAHLSYVLSMVPFDAGRSPWEILIYHNKQKTVAMDTHGKIENGCHDNGAKDDDGNRTILMFRFHHVLGDVPSFFVLLSKLAQGNKDYADKLARPMSSSKKVTPVGKLEKKQNFLCQFFRALFFPIVATYDLFNLTMNGWDSNRWHHGYPQLKSDFSFTSFQMTLDTIKFIRKVRGNVGFFTVLLTAYTGGLRRFMMSKGISVPQAMHTMVSVPRPRDPMKMCNQVTGSILTMPTGLNDRSAMVDAIESEVNGLKTSFASHGMWVLACLCGLFPQKMVANFWPWTTCFTVNVPGFEHQMVSGGAPWLSMRGISSIPGSIGVYIYACSYMGKLDIAVGVSRHIVGSIDDLEKLRGYIQQEIEALEKEPHLNIVCMN